MKALLLAGLLLIGTAGVALAGGPFRANIQQKDTGTVWTNQDSETAPVGGGSFLSVEIEDISTAATDFVSVHKPGRIAKMYVSQHTAVTVTGSVIHLMVGDGTAATSFTRVGSAGSDHLAVTPTGATSHAGAVTSYTFTPSDTTTHVDVGDSIAVVTDGSSTTASKGLVTIVIE